MAMHTFEAVLIRPEGTGTWTYLNVPFRAEEAFGSKAQVKVKGTVNGVPYRGSIMPHGDGSHYMVVKQELREAAGVTAGDSVAVTMELDTDKREVDVPQDLQAELETDEAAARTFDGLSYSHRKEYVTWIESAKKPETRTKRIARAVEMLAEGKKLK